MVDMLSKKEIKRLKRELEKTDIPTSVIKAILDEGKTFQQAWKEHKEKMIKLIGKDIKMGILKKVLGHKNETI